MMSIQKIKGGISATMLLLVGLLLMTACGTSEKNFKESYDQAKARAIERIGEEQYARQQAERMQANAVVAGDSVRLVRTFFNAVDAKAADLKRYNVVVAEFDQLINARSYRDRINAKDGVDCHLAFRNNDKKYCVCVFGSNQPEEAAEFLRNIKAHITMKILVPRAYILQKY